LVALFQIPGPSPHSEESLKLQSQRFFAKRGKDRI
jgi:hypothetical protein